MTTTEYTEERLHELKALLAAKSRQLALAQAGMTYNKLERYEKYLADVDNDDDLQKHAQALVDEVNEPDGFADAYDSRGVFKPFN